jgi:hypothetical protein
MQNKNQTLERKVITRIIINNLKCIILVDGFYSVTQFYLGYTRVLGAPKPGRELQQVCWDQVSHI